MPTYYIMLPSQSKPLQVVQGLDGVMYVLASPVNNVTDNHIGSVMPQGISFSSPSALAAAAAVQMNAGTLAAAALQGQKSASFPFIPVYTPLSVLLHSPTLLLHCRPFLWLEDRWLPTHRLEPFCSQLRQSMHAESSSNKRSVTSPINNTYLIRWLKMKSFRQHT